MKMFQSTKSLVRSARASKRSFGTFLLCLMAVLPRPVLGEHWPRFRGPEGRGSSTATNLPVQWTDADYDWSVKLPGIGHSSPIVWDDQLVVTSGDPDNGTRYVLCYGASDGAPQWRREFKSSTHPLHSRNSYASSTPVTDGRAVYVTWATPESYQLIALSLKDGRNLWDVDLGPFVSQHGFAISPIVYDDLVIVGNEQLGESFVAAYSGRDGKQVWKRARNSVKAAYSVPAVYQPKDGKPQLIFHSTAHGISSIEPTTGEQNWSLDVFTARCVASPLIAGDLILGSSGQGGSGLILFAVRPAPAGDQAEIVYKITDNAPYVVTPVVHNDLLFVWHDRGTVSCHRIATGERIWHQRVGGNYSASPVVVGNHIYCMEHGGEVVVLEAADEFRLVARNDLGERGRATPAVSGGRIFFRTESQLMALGGR